MREVLRTQHRWRALRERDLQNRPFDWSDSIHMGGERLVYKVVECPGGMWAVVGQSWRELRGG